MCTGSEGTIVRRRGGVIWMTITRYHYDDPCCLPTAPRQPQNIKSQHKPSIIEQNRIERYHERKPYPPLQYLQSIRNPSPGCLSLLLLDSCFSFFFSTLGNSGVRIPRFSPPRLQPTPSQIWWDDSFSSSLWYPMCLSSIGLTGTHLGCATNDKV